MLAAANEVVRTYSAAEAIERFDEGDCVFVDVRDEPELWTNGKIPGAIHASRGMLEFHLDPESPYFIEELGSGTELLFHCAVGGRPVLAAQRAGEMGLDRVAHVAGGFDAWTDAGGPVETVTHER